MKKYPAIFGHNTIYNLPSTKLVLMRENVWGIRVWNQI